jgi:hypothetical protein
MPLPKPPRKDLQDVSLNFDVPKVDRAVRS